MDFKQIQELIRLINKSNIGEITVEEKGFKITIKQKQEAAQQVLSAAPVYAQQPLLQQAPLAANAAPEKAKPVTTKKLNKTLFFILIIGEKPLNARFRSV